jgi:hypothetical protein
VGPGDDGGGRRATTTTPNQMTILAGPEESTRLRGCKGLKNRGGLLRGRRQSQLSSTPTLCSWLSGPGGNHVSAAVSASQLIYCSPSKGFWKWNMKMPPGNSEVMNR